MNASNDIVRQRQLAIRREMDRRGIALKAVAFDAGIPIPTLLTYFPADGSREPAMMPIAAVYKIIAGNALPLDLVSLVLPSDVQIVRVPEGVDYDEIETAAREFLAAKGQAHRQDSPGGPAIVECEQPVLDRSVVKLRAVS